MLLQTEHDVIEHLGRVTRGREHWVFLAENEARQTTSLLLAELALRGLPYGDVKAGRWRWLDNFTGARSSLALVTVSKANFSRGHVRDFLDAAGKLEFPGGRRLCPNFYFGPQPDTFLFSKDPERLAGFLILAFKGLLATLPDPSAN